MSVTAEKAAGSDGRGGGLQGVRVWVCTAPQRMGRKRHACVSHGGAGACLPGARRAQGSSGASWRQVRTPTGSAPEGSSVGPAHPGRFRSVGRLRAVGATGAVREPGNTPQAAHHFANAHATRQVLAGMGHKPQPLTVTARQRALRLVSCHFCDAICAPETQGTRPLLNPAGGCHAPRSLLPPPRFRVSEFIRAIRTEMWQRACMRAQTRHWQPCPPCPQDKSGMTRIIRQPWAPVKVPAASADPAGVEDLRPAAPTQPADSQAARSGEPPDDLRPATRRGRPCPRASATPARGAIGVRS